MPQLQDVHFIMPVGQTSSLLLNRVGVENETVIDPTTKELIVYDGVNKGGVRMARKKDVEDLTSEVKKLTALLEDFMEQFTDYYDGKAPAYVTLPEEE